VLGILAWQEGGEAVGALIAVGVVALGLLAGWLVRCRRRGRTALLDAGLFTSPWFRLGMSGQLLQQTALGGTMIALPIYLQMVLEYSALLAGLSLAPLSLTMFAVALIAGRRTGRRRPGTVIRIGFLLLVVGNAALIATVPRAEFGWALLVPLAIAGAGFGLLVSQLNAYTLGPIAEERAGEAAGVNSAAGSFGLSLGLALAGAVMLATLATTFTAEARASEVLVPGDQDRVAAALEHDAQVMSNTSLRLLVADEAPAVGAEVVRINTVARPPALQAALLVPLVAGLLGLLLSFGMTRLPDPEQGGTDENVLAG